MKKTFIILLLMAPAVVSFTQTVIMERSVEQSDTSEFLTVRSSRSTFSNNLMLGIPYGLGDEGAETKFWGTYHFEYGIHYNYRIADFFSLGGVVSYVNTAFRIRQTDNKEVVDTIKHDKEHFNLHGIGGGVYLRLTYMKGMPGRYVDFGVKEFYALGRSYTTWDKLNDVKVETITHKPKSIEPLQTYAYVSLGFNGLGIFANYRITDIFTEKHDIPEVSRLTAGIEININQ